MLAGVAACGLACTWVPLTPEGERVEVLPEGAASSCEQLGQTRVRTTDRIWIFARGEAKVLEEQASLARNEAARMGGNAVSPVEPSGGAERLFGVYRCPGRR
jgi:hypothetical protein